MVLSCAEERFDALPDYTVSGEPVKLKVPVLIPEMNAETRGDISENQLNRVESLWIRTYNAETLEATCEWKKLTPGTSDLHNMREVEINTQSGYTYIVAVANVSNMGVTSDDITNQKPLSELLEEADTWEKFLKIAVVSPSDQDDVNAPQTNTLPMCGCYSDTHVTYNQWQKTDFQPYFIPASKEKVEFKGGIHLRRLVSHITFNFKSGDPNMELEVNSYRVMNAPKFSWLYERSSENTTLANFGDAATEENAGTYYADIPQFGSQFIKHNDNGIQTFNFWQAENKHNGNCDKYSDRDAKTEKKTEEDSITLFTSLTGDTWTPNNEASYVMVDCTIEYRESLFVDQDGYKVDPGTQGGESVTRSGNATYFIHLGNILGSTLEEKAKDFNCFRNVDYTYNVTVNGIDDIRIDAIANEEKYHGEEGLVVDLLDNAIDIDAHYAVFNIKLTEKELQENFGFIITTYDNGEQITLSEKNPRADVGSGKIVIYADKEMKNPIDPKYYNWIELRPTTGENVLAEYKPRFLENADGKTFLLTDMYNEKDVNGNNKLVMPDGCKSTSGYYTVFVNEYTYEPIYGEKGYGNESKTTLHGKPAWMSYVNQNPRRFYIKVSYRASEDGNSVYARSKYAVEQRSLMTYYSQINVDTEGTAIGVERENETLGLNLRHANNSGGSSTTNGRWNAAQYLSTGGVDDYGGKNENYTDSERPWDAISVNRPYDSQKSAWATFLEMSEPLEVPGVTDKMYLQGGPAIMARTIANGNPHKLRKIKQRPDDNPHPGPGPNENYVSFTDPQQDPKYNIRAMSAFINRNRDNNGNGKIDAEELRWYIPAITRYVGMTLGETAMPQRLMMFDEIKRLPYVNNNKNGFSDVPGEINYCFYNRYMYLASNDGNADNNVLWSHEGTSLSKFWQVTSWSTEDSDHPVNPWQIRCVRNLGSDLTTVKKEDKVSIPFEHDAANRKLKMRYFNLAAIRTIQYTGNGPDNPNFMPIHTINSTINSVYSSFQYAETDIIYSKPSGENKNNFSGNLITYINSNPCAKANLEGQNWRVPNQIELTMIYESGALSGIGGYWLSSTVEYFNRNNGEGTNEITNKLFMGAANTKPVLLSWDNYSPNTIKIRCVRDVNP